MSDAEETPDQELARKMRAPLRPDPEAYQTFRDSYAQEINSAGDEYEFGYIFGFIVRVMVVWPLTAIWYLMCGTWWIVSNIQQIIIAYLVVFAFVFVLFCIYLWTI